MGSMCSRWGSERPDRLSTLFKAKAEYLGVERGCPLGSKVQLHNFYLLPKLCQLQMTKWLPKGSKAVRQVWKANQV